MCFQKPWKLNLSRKKTLQKLLKFDPTKIELLSKSASTKNQIFSFLKSKSLKKVNKQLGEFEDASNITILASSQPQQTFNFFEKAMLIKNFLTKNYHDYQLLILLISAVRPLINFSASTVNAWELWKLEKKGKRRELKYIKSSKLRTASFLSLFY